MLQVSDLVPSRCMSTTAGACTTEREKCHVPFQRCLSLLYLFELLPDRLKHTYFLQINVLKSILYIYNILKSSYTVRNKSLIFHFKYLKMTVET